MELSARTTFRPKSAVLVLYRLAWRDSLAIKGPGRRMVIPIGLCCRCANTQMTQVQAVERCGNCRQARQLLTLKTMSNHNRQFPVSLRSLAVIFGSDPSR